jgi:2-polyprenyl-3-methyl-5-hydroxy-6-metoxy-1,4-benzoquinol methylase
MSNYSESYFDESAQNTSWYKVFHLIKKETNVLDVGSSSGNFGKVLTDKKGCTVDGIELDKADAKEASKKLNNVWVLNIESDDLSGIPHNFYDYIYFGDVIEHLVTPIQTLERIKPLFKKSGSLIFSIPNMGHVGVRLALLKGQFEYTETGLTDKTHLHFYTKDEVERVLQEAGYSLEELDFIQKDYPKELLKNKLDEIGLSANKKFYDLINKPDASAFQFVGLARPSKATKRKLKKFGPIDLFEKFHEDTKTNYEIEINNLKSELEMYKKQAKQPIRTTVGKIKRRLKH